MNTNIYSYLETSGGQSSNLHLNVAHFLNTRADEKSMAALQFKTAVFLHLCLILAIPLQVLKVAKLSEFTVCF